MNKEIVIGITLYNPNQSTKDRILKTMESGYDVFIFDNSPEKMDYQDLFKSNNSVKARFHYYTCGKNVGLGYAISTLCAQAYYELNSALIFFDQDTMFTQQTLEYIENMYIESKEQIKEYSAINFLASNNHESKEDKYKIEDVSLAINSGSLYILENVKKLNWHNIHFFVDCVDYEFCLKSYNNGYKIGLINQTPGFDHFSEQGDLKFKIFGKEYQGRPYKSSRLKDYTLSSLKLIFKSLLTGNFYYFRVFIVSLLKYWFVQIYIRFIKQ